MHDRIQQHGEKEYKRNYENGRKKGEKQQLTGGTCSCLAENQIKEELKHGGRLQTCSQDVQRLGERDGLFKFCSENRGVDQSCLSDQHVT